MNAKQKFDQVVADLRNLSQSENVYLAKMKAHELADKWAFEAEQMFDDKENRVIFGASITLALMAGFLTGFLFCTFQ